MSGGPCTVPVDPDTGEPMGRHKVIHLAGSWERWVELNADREFGPPWDGWLAWRVQLTQGAST